MSRRRTGASLDDALDLFASEAAPPSLPPASASASPAHRRTPTRAPDEIPLPAARPRRGRARAEASPAPNTAADAGAATAYEAIVAELARGGVDPYAAGADAVLARVGDGALDPFDASALLDGASRHSAPGESPEAAVAVSTLTHTAKDVLEGAFVPLWVRGEITDFKRHRNGHWYFCLRDAAAQVKCVMWSRDAVRMPTTPDDGMEVAALGQITVYAARGDMQLVVRRMDARGDGLWRKALDEARARLAADGLLDPTRRRPLPRLPRRVAIVTSPDGAALHDVVAVARRRCALVELVLVPAKVQGDGAAEELVAALERAGRSGLFDVVIVGRGGGAREDLWAFNDERLARAVASCPVPVVSAVGHEVDVTLCDLVADVRAATPSAAAEAVVPVLAELRAQVGALGAGLADAIAQRLLGGRAALADVSDRLAQAADRAVERRQARLAAVAGRLDALSPMATLARGYAVARAASGATLSRAADFAPGAPFELLVRDGVVRATADDVRADPPLPPATDGAPADVEGASGGRPPA